MTRYPDSACEAHRNVQSSEPFCPICMSNSLTTTQRDLETANLRCAELEAKVEAHRQAIWDALGHLGYDRDGDPTPAAFVYPPLTKVIVDVAREFRAEYDEMLRDTPLSSSPPSEGDKGGGA